jgi:triosephosphate isomerase
VELHGHSRHTVAQAAGIATAVGATLTLVHITESVETYGPGGYHVDPVLREQHVGFAREEIAKLAPIVIAYEPVWASGDGETATPDVAAAAHKFIRAQAEARFGSDAAGKLRI